MRNIQTIDIKEDNFCCFPMISIPLYRVWVLKRRKLKNSLRFSFLPLVTHWFADRLNGDQRNNLRDFLF